MSVAFSQASLDKMTEAANEALRLEIRDALIDVVEIARLIKEASAIAERIAAATDQVLPYEECHRLISKAKIELCAATYTTTELVYAFSVIPRVQISIA